MTIPFFKYQGTGNDFIMVDNRQSIFSNNNAKLIASLCDRRFGIGGDGLILLENDELSDFRMVYFNADGNEGSLCGNGARCTIAFAKYLNIITENTVFKAVDGLHNASIDGDTVSLHMQNLSEIILKREAVFLDTGSPHHVQMVNDIDGFDVFKEGKKIRYGIYGKSGSNINFVTQTDVSSFSVRTYERGVENETLSCGTGVTAVALAMNHIGKTNANQLEIKTLGGELKVSFEKDGGIYQNIQLIGPAKQVFKGEIEC
ncbi:hypothetical protein LCGC14_1120270 [marine sediment metagenome]|uniref:Diaminopimelate epimerase n=2 Tax=root TaxID=1 RepID=A0A831QPB5_9FLAO|nr:diaminopimelate epimerase [Pricia antarctica]